MYGEHFIAFLGVPPGVILALPPRPARRRRGRRVVILLTAHCFYCRRPQDERISVYTLYTTCRRMNDATYNTCGWQGGCEARGTREKTRVSRPGEDPRVCVSRQPCCSPYFVFPGLDTRVVPRPPNTRHMRLPGGKRQGSGRGKSTTTYRRLSRGATVVAATSLRNGSPRRTTRESPHTDTLSPDAPARCATCMLADE